MLFQIATVFLGVAVVAQTVAIVRMLRSDVARRAAVDTLAATVAKMQADQRTQPRAAGAPPVGAFSFKGASK